MAIQHQPLDFDLPGWARRTLAALGLTTVIDGVVRYTFFGEFVERVVQRTLGEGRYQRITSRARSSK